MKIDAIFTLDSLNQVPSAASAAESIGFDAIWQGEARHEGMLPLPLIAEHTQRVQFGNAIIVAFARSPMIVAYAAWDLAEQSSGRYVLGLGTQVKAHVERRFGTTWEPPAPKLREMIRAIRAIWDCWQNGKPLDFRGQFYRFTLMSPFFNPGPIATPRVPIFIAGLNPAICRLAGEVADGFHIHPFHSAKSLREVIIPDVAAGAAKSGRSLSDVQLASAVLTATNEAERDAAREQIAFFASTPSYRSVLEWHGWGETGERLSQLAAQGRWSEMPRQISDEMLETVAVVAPSADLPAKLVAKYRGLLDRVSLHQPFHPEEKDDYWRALVEGVHAL